MTARLSVIPAVAFEDPRLLPSDIKVLGTLGSFLNRDYEAWPSQGLIAERARLDRKTVNRALRKLVDFGYVRASAKYPNAKMKSVMKYRVIMDEDVRLPEEFEQPDLFGESASIPPKTRATADGENFPKQTRPEPKSPDFPDGENFPNCKSDEAPRRYNDGASGRPNNMNYTSRTSPDSSVSNETAAGDENGDEGEHPEPASQPTRSELLKSLIFATGVPLLTGQGMRDQAARAFLGSLIKAANLEIVSRVLQRAANDPPIDARGWLRASVLSECKRAGIATKAAPSADERSLEAEQKLEIMRQRFATLRDTGKWRPNWGMDPRIGVRDDVPASLYDEFRIPWPEHELHLRPKPVAA